MILSRFCSLISILLFSFSCQTVLAVSASDERTNIDRNEKSRITQALLSTVVSLHHHEKNQKNIINVLSGSDQMPASDKFALQRDYGCLKAETFLKHRLTHKSDGKTPSPYGEEAFYRPYCFSFISLSLHQLDLLSVSGQTKEERHNISQQIRAREWLLV